MAALFCVRRRHFGRLVRRTLRQLRRRQWLGVHPSALFVLQEALEAYATTLLHESAVVAQRERRCTVVDRDVRLARRLLSK